MQKREALNFPLETVKEKLINTGRVSLSALNSLESIQTFVCSTALSRDERNDYHVCLVLLRDKTESKEHLLQFDDKFFHETIYEIMDIAEATLEERIRALAVVFRVFEQ
jgi:hypothetical protein